MGWNWFYVCFFLLLQISPCILQKEVVLLEALDLPPGKQWNWSYVDSSGQEKELNWKRISVKNGKTVTRNNANEDPTLTWANEIRRYKYDELTESRDFQLVNGCTGQPPANVDNWLFLPHIKPNSTSNIYIQINFTMQNNKTRPIPKGGQFHLLYAPSHTEITPDVSKFKLIRPVLSGEKIYNRDQDIEREYLVNWLNSETRTIGNRNAAIHKGVHFAIRDTGTCVNIFGIKIFLKRCVNKTESFARFPSAIANFQYQPIHGKCVPGAQRLPGAWRPSEPIAACDRYGAAPTITAAESEPIAACDQYGEWFDYSLSKCECAAGFQPRGTTYCEKCPPNTYKPAVGSSSCQPCPANSSTVDDLPRNICPCNPGFFRSASQNASNECSRLEIVPDKPNEEPSYNPNITVTEKGYPCVPWKDLTPFERQKMFPNNRDVRGVLNYCQYSKDSDVLPQADKQRLWCFTARSRDGKYIRGRTANPERGYCNPHEVTILNSLEITPARLYADTWNWRRLPADRDNKHRLRNLHGVKEYSDNCKKGTCHGWLNTKVELNYSTSSKEYYIPDIHAVTACNTVNRTTPSWLFVPHIARRPTIYVQIKFATHDCALCNETFELFYALSSSEDRPDDTSKYLPIKPAMIAPARTFPNKEEFVKDPRKFINTETRMIGDRATPFYDNSPYVHIAIKDKGTCANILIINIYYKRCLAITVLLAYFPETISSSTFQPVPGRCVHGAQHVTMEPILMICGPGGDWRPPGTPPETWPCQCAIGFQPSNSGDRCEECPDNTYKVEIGNSRCKRCPPNSETVRDLHRNINLCTCKRGFFRSINNSTEIQCNPGWNENVTYSGNTVILLDTDDKETLLWIKVQERKPGYVPPKDHRTREKHKWTYGGYKIPGSPDYSKLLTTISTCACECNKRYDVENWLISPYINIKNIPTIHILINFTMRNFCFDFTKNNPNSSCARTLKLFYAPITNDNHYPKRSEYRPTDLIINASREVYGENKDLRNYMNTEIRTLGDPTTPLNGAIGLRFAIVDTGSCAEIFRIIIYHKQCIRKNVSLVYFPATDISATCDITIGGQCVEGAEKFNAKLMMPTAVCDSSGRWTIRSGSERSCRCSPGFRKIISDGIESCTKCEKNTYKDAVSDASQCETCPKNTVTVGDNRTSCMPKPPRKLPPRVDIATDLTGYGKKHSKHGNYGTIVRMNGALFLIPFILALRFTLLPDDTRK